MGFPLEMECLLTENLIGETLLTYVSKTTNIIQHLISRLSLI